MSFWQLILIYIQFNVIYFNCAFTKLIVPKAGNITLATMPARESWVMARFSHSCSQSVGLIAVTVTTVSVVFCIVHNIVWLALPNISCFRTVGSRCVVACRSAVFESPRVLGAVLCVLPAISPCPFPRLRFCILLSFLHYLDGKYRF
jgi:hypothetical protein